jgi:hypothetical protein
MKFSKQLGFGITLLLLASGFALAQNIPLNNWTVPPYSQSSHSGGITTMADVTSPRLFIGVQPCRVADTRGNGAPITGGIFPNSGLRTWDLTGICGIPAGADAISVNFTVVAAAGIPAGSFLLAWPTGQAPPPTAIMTYGPGQIISNAAIVPLGPGEQINVNVSGSTHVIMDVNGYFSDTLQTPQNYLSLTNDSSQYTAYFTNNSGSCSGPCGVVASVASGIALEGTATNDTGVYGSSISGFGVNGVSDTNVGVKGVSNSYNGLWGESATQDGIFGSGGRDGAYIQGARHGVLGNSLAGAGQVYGVSGGSVSTNSFAAGVHGSTNQLLANGGAFENTAIGSTQNSFLATQVSGTNYAFYSSSGRILAHDLAIVGGSKSFASPHPEDPGLQIRYYSVEAPTVDVYFRGTAELVNGIARVEIPDHFRYTAREGTYMTTLTAVGRAANLSVESEGPEGIVVRGTGSVRFHYVVYAERAELEGYPPVMRNVLFTPEALSKGGSIDDLPATTRAILVRNGTLNPDGTFNAETAQAHGWTIPERPTNRPAPAPNP